MDPNETMVEENFDNEATDDTLPEEVVEETDESEETLDSITEDEQPAEEQADETAPKANEPGYVQKRIRNAVAKALAQQKAEFEQMMAPIREKMLNDEAKELVKQGEFKTFERAKEYLQLKQGLPVATTSEAPQQNQPRNSQGQFAPKEDPVVTARIGMLTHQADRIKESGGPDVIAEFKNNPKIKKAVINGEMDFYDVAEQMKNPRRKPPSPMRSPNGASGQNNPNAIDLMSDEQFRKLEKRIAEGARIRLS